MISSRDMQWNEYYNLIENVKDQERCHQLRPQSSNISFTASSVPATQSHAKSQKQKQHSAG